jgi:enoyl-CoA hydratase/carnithine racemase
MTQSSSTIRWEQDGDGIVTLTLEDPDHSVNLLNAGYLASVSAAVGRLEAEQESVTGVILTSAKDTFFDGADLGYLLEATTADLPGLAQALRAHQSCLRRMETLGKPVVAAINGAALGAGLEITLAAHHRIIVDDQAAVTGFPDVGLGLAPAVGGLSRAVRLLGIERALTGWLTQGQRHTPAEAAAAGLIDQVVATAADLIPAARKWIAENRGARQPWDTEEDYQIPGGTPASLAFALNLPGYPAILRRQLKGASYPAPKLILASAIDGVQVGFDAALETEARYFLTLLTGPVARNLIQAYHVDLAAVRERVADGELTQEQGQELLSRADPNASSFASRLLRAFLDEGTALVAEGIPASSIEQACAQAGYETSVLALASELGVAVARDVPPVENPADLSLRELSERLLFIQALEAVKARDEGLIESAADANVGSIFGAGFPGWAGGALQYISTYAPPADPWAPRARQAADAVTGPTAFVARARVLAAAYGPRFEPPASLVKLAEQADAA